MGEEYLKDASGSTQKPKESGCDRGTADHEPLKVMSGVPAVFETIVQIREALRRLEVGGVFGVEPARFIAGDEREMSDVLWKLMELKFSRCGLVRFRLQIMQGEAGEVGHKDVAWGLLAAPFVL